MAIYVFVTKQVQQDAQRMGYSPQKLAQFAASVEAAQSTDMFDRFPPPCLTKKKLFAFPNRLIAADRKIDNHLIVVLLRLLTRGSKEYRELREDAAVYAERALEQSVQTNELHAWLNERKTQPPPPPPPAATMSELEFLWSHSTPSTMQDAIVFETTDWMEAVADPRIAPRLVLVPNTIATILDKCSSDDICAVDTDPALKIIYRYFPSHNWLLLISASYDTRDSVIHAIRHKWNHLSHEATKDAIVRASARSYPALVCYDPDLWMAVEKDPLANLALSPEEAEILDSTRHQPSATSGYPLFINGRAGSGKSTLLQYLFADYYAAWLTTLRPSYPDASAPLYFASSAELLKVAQKAVAGLLTANCNMLLREVVDDSAAALQLLPASFRHFHDFLYSLLEPTEKATGFKKDWRVTYPSFRKLWIQRFGKEPRALRDYGPQLSWHVVRSYLKGLSLDGETDHEDYDDLARDERTVSHERFRLVYDKVWLGWYRNLCRAEGFWDDQDLVRYLLDNGRLRPQHSAIVCDEAQDFTRIEIEAIYRLCVFSDRLLEPEAIRRVPLAFAGDPFQTLNPTGFRWEAIKAGFTERLLCSLHRYYERCSVPPLNYHELCFNYRSVPDIVHFCNSIQAVRGAALNISGLRPQSAWRMEYVSRMPAFFAESDPALRSRFNGQPDIVVIVPCEEGEEEEFVRASPFLTANIQRDDEGTPRNVLSPSRAKGLEFNRVLLYGFAQQPEAKLLEKQLEARAQTLPVDRDESLPLEYFMNGLYVAASRAKKRLFVVDPEASLNGLWRFAVDEDHMARLIRLMPRHGDGWRENLGYMIRGVEEHWSDAERDNPLEIAVRFEEQGRRDLDAYLMKQAAMQYGSLKNDTKAEECRAYADKFERRFTESGHRFCAAGLYRDALQAYWDGAHFRQVCELIQLRPDLASAPEARIAAFLTEDGATFDAAVRVFEHVYAAARDGQRFQIEIATASWQKALNDVLRKCTVGKVALPHQAKWAALARMLRAIEELGLAFERAEFAKVLYRAGQFEDVLAVLSDMRANELVRDATAQLALKRSGGNPNRVPNEEARLVAELFLREGRVSEAARWFCVVGEVLRLEECLIGAVDGHEQDKDILGEVMSAWTHAAIEKGHFEIVLAVYTSGRITTPRAARRSRGDSHAPPLHKESRFANPTPEQRRVLVEVIKRENKVLTSVIPALARAEQLNWSTGREVAEFLRSRLLADEGNWQNWRRILPAVVAGAAIERAGKDIDALQFYERLSEDEASTASEVTLAKKRWIKCKLRQAQREKTLAEIEGRPTRRETASTYQEVAEAALRASGWGQGDLGPEFPELPTTEESDNRQVHARTQDAPRAAANVPSAEAAETVTTLGTLTLRHFRDRSRINVESQEGDTARIDLARQSVVSSDVRFIDQGQGVFACPEWSLNIRFDPALSEAHLTIKNDSRAITFAAADASCLQSHMP